MKSSRRSIMSKLDDHARLGGFTPERVADDMSGDTSVHHRPLRWIPLLYIGVACALLIVLYWVWTREPDQFDPGGVIAVMTAIVLALGSGAKSIYTRGPLGKASGEDDEREAALRKDSFLFCLGLLAGLNCLGQPILWMVSYWRDWQSGFSLFVALCVLTLNATLLSTLPTLYASWNYPRLPKE